MSATDELRRLLDERGVEHEDSELTDHGDRTTTYYTEWGGNDDGDGANVYVEYMDGTVLRMFDATPAQAIAATLGNDGVGRTNDGVDGCYLMRDGEKFPVELDYEFTGLMPIAIEVGGFRYLLEGPNEE